MAITVAPGDTFEAVCVGFDTGLVGTVGVAILDNAGATSVVRTTAGISEYPVGSGIYTKTLTAPSTAGQYTILFDSGTISPTTITTEPLTVTVSAAAISAAGTNYITAAALKASLTLTGETFADDDVDAAITAASRSIDQTCNRRFWLDADNTSVRVYTPASAALVSIDDIVDVVSVKTDTGGDYAYATTLVADTDYLLYPYNAVDDSEPYTHLEANPRNGYQFYCWPKWVQVTGQFGWSAVPAQIAEATTIFAARLVKRKREAPMGVFGFGMDGVAVRVPTLDPDIASMVSPFIRHGV